MKQTEIGLIPDDWEVKKLGNITTHVDYRGKTPKKTNMGIQLITAKNIRMGYIDYKNNQEFVSPTDYSEVMKRGLPQKGDVLITTEAPAGNVAQIDNENIALAQRVIKYRGNETLNNDYLCHYFLSDCFQNLLRAMNTGGTVQGIKGSLLHTLPVIVPPLPEQQRIAKALSDVDAAISTIEKLIQKKKNIKQGTMQNLLTGKKRLPGFAKSAEYKQTELGLIPEDWDVKELNKCGYFIGGGTPDTNNLNYWKGSIPWISSSDLRKDEVRTVNPSRFITNEAIQNSATKLCPQNTILIVSRVGVGKLAISENEVCTSQDFSNFVCTEYDILYLVYQLSQILQKKADEAQGTSIKGITTDEVKLIKVVIPSKQEQTAIANVLSSMDKEIETLNTKLEKYRNIKTAMMQQLLTGKIRLKNNLL